MSENMREYRRGLALYVVAHGAEPLTAAEIAEAMGEMAMSEGHPPACWASLDGPAVLGILRALENSGLVEQGTATKRHRAGREAPTWRYSLGAVAAKKVQLPDPPQPNLAELSARAQRAPADDSPYSGMTRQQLYAVLEVSDLYVAQCAQFMQQVHATNSRARRILAAAGLGDLTGEQAG